MNNMNKNDKKDIEMVQGLQQSTFQIEQPNRYIIYLIEFINKVKGCLCMRKLSSYQMQMVNVKIWNTEMKTLKRAAQIAKEVHGSPVDFDEKSGVLHIYYIQKNSVIVGALHGKFPKWMEETQATNKEEIKLEIES